MTNYTISYTEEEELAMQYIATSVDDWLQNAAHERARQATDEIVQLAVRKFLESGQPIPSSKLEIVSTAYSNNWIKTAVQRNTEAVLEQPVTPTAI
jgi:hypothetical protein